MTIRPTERAEVVDEAAGAVGEGAALWLAEAGRVEDKGCGEEGEGVADCEGVTRLSVLPHTVDGNSWGDRGRESAEPVV